MCFNIDDQNARQTMCCNDDDLDVSFPETLFFFVHLRTPNVLVSESARWKVAYSELARLLFKKKGISQASSGFRSLKLVAGMIYWTESIHSVVAWHRCSVVA